MVSRHEGPPPHRLTKDTGTGGPGSEASFRRLKQEDRIGDDDSRPAKIPLMDPEQLQTIAARDQLWSNLRALLPEINNIASGQLDGSPRQQELIQVIARIVAAELTFRNDDARDAGDDRPREAGSG